MKAWIAASFKSFVAVLLTTFAIAPMTPAGAESGNVRTGLSVYSPTLGRAIPYAIYLPGASSAPSTPMPVLYLLHGRGDDEMAWLEKGRIADVLDAMIAAKAIQPLVVVMPAAGNSWYVNDMRPSGYGRIADAFTTDLIAGVESTLQRAPGCRQGRAVGGLSMGGFGAVMYALERPDLFNAAFSLSGSLFSNKPDDIERRTPVYERLFEGVYGTPFVQAHFLRWNVFEKLDTPRLRADPVAVWLSAGDRDFPSIVAGTNALYAELRHRQMESELHMVPGEHTWALWHETVQPALIWLSRHLDAGCGAAKQGPQGR